MAKFRSEYSKRPVRFGQFPCDELLPGDGIDPRYDREEKRVSNRKALQLCAQVADSLNLIFPSLKDEILRELYVVSVVPAPDSTQLLVTVQGNHEDVANRLAVASGLLRTEVAQCISRKRVPNLKFRYIRTI